MHCAPRASAQFTLPEPPNSECKSRSPSRQDFLSPDRHVGGGRVYTAVVANQTDRLFMAVFTTATEITVFPGGRWSAAWNITVRIYYGDRRRRRRRRDGQTRDVPRQSIKRQERRPIKTRPPSPLNPVGRGQVPSSSAGVFGYPLRFEDRRPWLSHRMNDGTSAALGGHSHTPSPRLSLTRTCTLAALHPALLFAAEMVPAWANLHNTLLTPLLYSSITAGQLLQVRVLLSEHVGAGVRLGTKD